MPLEFPLRHHSLRRILYGVVAILIAIAAGTTGFRLIEGWDLIDCVYMTVTTLTTVGYGEVHPLSSGGRIFAIILMVVGVGVVAFALSTILQLVVQSEIIAAFGTKRRTRGMRRLHSHVILCGAGRVGSHIVRDLIASQEPFVVIEKDRATAASIKELGVEHVIYGDATTEETLNAAGIDKARGLVACLPDDAENLYIVLVARDLNKGINIVARAVEESAQPRLLKAGANRVVAPTLIGGHQMALGVLKPDVGDFFESLSTGGLELNAEQVEIGEGSDLVDLPLRSAVDRSRINVVIVSIKRSDGSYIFNPSADTEIKNGDVLIVIGDEIAVGMLKMRASGVSAQHAS